MIILFAPVVKDKMAVKPCGVPEVIGNVKQDNTTVDVRRIQTGTLGFLQQSYEEDNRYALFPDTMEKYLELCEDVNLDFFYPCNSMLPTPCRELFDNRSIGRVLLIPIG